MRFLGNVALLLAFSIYITSCSKEDSNEIANLEESSSSFSQYQGNRNISLSNTVLEATIQDGMLSFEDVEAFNKAQTIIENSSDEDFFNWSASNGFYSLWEDYSKVSSRFGDQFISPDSDVLSTDEKSRYRIVNTEEGYELESFLKGRVLPALVTLDGYVMIANQLHFFSNEMHILVANKDRDLMDEIKLTPDKDWNVDGVVITLQEVTKAEPVERVQTKFEPCPDEGVSHQEVVGNQKLVVEFFTYIFTTNWTSGLVQYNGSARGLFHNYKKKLIGWKSTGADINVSVTKPGTFTLELWGFLNGQFVMLSSGDAPISTFSQNVLDVESVDVLLTGLQTGLEPTGLTMERHYTSARIRGFRISPDNTSPNLDITVGCQ